MRLVRSQRLTASDALQIEVQPRGRSVTYVRLTGEIDAASVPQLEACLADLAHRGARRLEIDLDRVTRADSTAVGVFLAAHRRMATMGGTIELVDVPAGLRRILDKSGLDQVVNLRAIAPSPTPEPGGRGGRRRLLG